MEDRLLNTEEYAGLIGCRPQTVINRRGMGTDFVPHIRLGRLVRYRLSDVQAFIAQRDGTSATAESSK